MYLFILLLLTVLASKDIVLAKDTYFVFKPTNQDMYIRMTGDGKNWPHGYAMYVEVTSKPNAQKE